MLMMSSGNASKRMHFRFRSYASWPFFEFSDRCRLIGTRLNPREELHLTKLVVVVKELGRTELQHWLKIVGFHVYGSLAAAY